MPIDQVMVGELRVVGDVLQVVEHPLTGSRHDDRNGHWIHCEPEVYWPVGQRDATRLDAPLSRASGEAHSVTVLEMPDDLARQRRLAPCRAT